MVRARQQLMADRDGDDLMEQEQDILISELQTLTNSILGCDENLCEDCETDFLRIATIADKLREMKDLQSKMLIPEECIPGIYRDVRDYFVANYLDGQAGGVVTVKSEFLADDIAELFSNEYWIMDQMRKHFVTGLKWED